MSKVDSAIPEAGKADAKQLAAIDADTLAQYVVDQTHPWWRRRPCVEALQGRVPEERVPGLLDRIRDPEDTSEVRIALLELLGDRIALLPYLVTVTSDERYGVYEQALHTRGRLGDLSAAPQLAELAASPWNHRARLAEAGLDLLLAQHGSAAVEKAVGSDTAAGRTFLDRIRAREHADLTPSLAHPDLGVARRAVELILSTGRPDNEHLLDHVVTGPTLDARLWAVYALHRRGRDVRDLWAALDRPRVELPALPEDVRTAIVNTYPSETYCDPRGWSSGPA